MKHYFDKDRLHWRHDDCLAPELDALGWVTAHGAKDVSLPPNTHPGLEVHLLVSGRVGFWVREGDGREVYEVGPGEAFLTPPGQEHGGVDEVMQPCQVFWLQVVEPPGRQFAGMTRGETRDLLERLANPEKLRLKLPPICELLFKSMVEEHLAPGLYTPAMLRATLTRLLVLVAREQEAAPPRVGPPTHDRDPINRAVAWMNQHLESGFSIDEAAAVSGLSPRSFHDRFRARMGLTPGDWRTRRRIDLAKQMLRDPHLSVTAVALRAGFSSSQYFSTVFRRFVGVTPHEYRERR